MKISFDTNLLIYAIDADAGIRHQEAVELVAQAANVECTLTLQSLGEFFHVATRKCGIAPEVARRIVQRWRAVFPTIAANEADAARAMDAVCDHALPYWDALLWATVDRAGCSVLFTEDFQTGRTLGAVTFVDPFRADNAAIVARALHTSGPS